MGLYDEASKIVGDNDGLFVKFQSGTTVRLRVLDFPRVYVKAFKADEEPDTRFSWPVWDYEAKNGDNKGRIRILDKGRGFFKSIKAIVAEYGEELPMDCDLVISTTGEGLKARYNIIPGKVKADLPRNWQLDMPDMEDKVPNSWTFESYIKMKAADVKDGGDADAPADSPEDTDKAKAAKVMGEEDKPVDPKTLEEIPF